MRYLALLLATIATALAGEFREASTGIVFPEKCAAWTRTRVAENPRKKDEVLVSYSILNGSAVTCRVFDGQISSPSADADMIRKEMEEISAGVFAVWQERGAKVELVLPIGPLPSDKHQFVMLHRITHAGLLSTSITLFRFYKGRYLSFRFTTPEQDSTAAFHEMGRFLSAVG